MPDPRNRLNWNATCKVYPAIADLQAIENVILLTDDFPVLVAGTNYRDIYTIPANNLGVSVSFTVQCNTNNPTNWFPYIKRGATRYYLDSDIYPVLLLTRALAVRCPALNGDIFGIAWDGCIIGDFLISGLVVYLVPQY